MKASKLTARGLAYVVRAVGRKIAKAHRAKQTPHGKQTVKKLMAHGTSTNSLELSGDTKLFDRVARKWNVDYAFYQTEPGEYLLFFKSGQADAMTACFSEYSRKVLDKAKSRQPTIPEQMKQAEQQLAKEKPPKENRAPAKSQDFVGRGETTERADSGMKWPKEQSGVWFDERRCRMTDKLRKYVLPNIPYVFIGWVFLKLGTAYRLAAGGDFAHKLLGLGQTIGAAFADFAPGLAPFDWLVGIVCAAAFRLLIYFKSKNAKKYRRDAEYGSARWSA